MKSLDLSNFQTKKVDDVESMFKGCNALVYLDISNFNFDSLYNYELMFDNLLSIKYINIYNITNGVLINEIKKNEYLNKDDITVCQKEQIITNPNAIYTCYNSTNYIIIKYKESMNYSLFNDNCPERNKISYINNQGSILKVNDIILIKENKPIKIYFNNPIESLENFFNGDIDSNSKKIIYIDFTHFDSSLIKNTKNMINGCDSLEYLDISFFDFSNVNLENINHIFSGLNSIKYINISNVSNSDILKAEISENSDLNSVKNLTICQTDYIINNINAIYVCLPKEIIPTTIPTTIPSTIPTTYNNPYNNFNYNSYNNSNYST